MNRARRAEIARAVTLLQEAQEILSAVADEEREAFENLPESLQDGERGQAMSEAADLIEEQAGTVEGVIDELAEFAQ